MGNYLVNYFKQRIRCDFFSYLGGAFVNTLASFGLINGAALSLLQSGTANLDNPAVMAAMFAMGYMLDVSPGSNAGSGLKQ